MDIFANAVRLFRQTARREFEASEAGRFVSELSRLRRGGTVSDSTVRKVSRQLQRLSMRGVLGRGELGQLAEQYARRGSGDGLGEVARLLGPIGSFLKSLIRPGGSPLAGLDAELEGAANLLRAFGWKVQKPSGGGRSSRKGSVEAAQSFLESLGFTVTPPGQSPPPGSAGTGRGRGGRGRGASEPAWTVSVPGRERKYLPNDPILTGKMIDVSSSNVHSIGFLWNWDDPPKGTLMVRFLQERGSGRSRKTSPGPTYYYYGIAPELFDAFETASSKGEFVWDKLRVRGTVSGHQYHYELKGITGYVPRKATRFGNKEYFIGRSIEAQNRRTGELRRFESVLPDQFVGYVDRGEPDRGGPDRGTPNRGR